MAIKLSKIASWALTLLSDFLDDVFDRIQSQDMKMNGQTISYEWEYIRMIEMKGKFQGELIVSKYYILSLLFYEG